VLQADGRGKSPFDIDEKVKEEVRGILTNWKRGFKMGKQNVGIVE